MTNLFKLLLLLSSLIHVAKLTTVDDDEPRSAYIRTTENSMLVGFTFNKERTDSIFKCAYCLLGRVSHCQSFNYDKRNGVCYQNSKSIDGNEKELSYAEDYTYGEMVRTIYICYVCKF